MSQLVTYRVGCAVKHVATLQTFKGICHLCGIKGHKAIDHLNSGKCSKIVKPILTSPEPQKFRKRCVWCNQNHSSYECNIYDKVKNHVMNKNMINHRVGGYNNMGNRGYSVRGCPDRGYSVRGYPNNGYPVRGYPDNI